MEIIQGKHALQIDASALAGRMAACRHSLIDIGTGDGRFVRHIAATHADTLAIGVDACRENLRDVSRRAPHNTLFVIANAQALPRELYGLADHITINFPWGSLLAGLLNADAALLDGLASVARPGAVLEVRLNAGALAEAGRSLEDGGHSVRRALCAAGFEVRAPHTLNAQDLRACPTTWAKRLAFGRDPRALYLGGRLS